MEMVEVFINGINVSYPCDLLEELKNKNIDLLSEVQELVDSLDPEFIRNVEVDYSENDFFEYKVCVNYNLEYIDEFSTNLAKEILSNYAIKD